MNRLHGILFAYRAGLSLRELTRHRNICSIPYGGRYRAIDFMLSNFVNAGISDIGLIVHSSYQSLLDHVGSGKDWDISRKHGGLRILPPFGYARRRASGDYNGHMDALLGVYSYLEKIRQDYIVLAGGDLIVNLPIEEIFEAHLRTGADITAVCTQAPKGDPLQCDYFTVDDDGFISGVSVCPGKVRGLEALEVYILSKELLIRAANHCAAKHISAFHAGIFGGFGEPLKIRPFIFDAYAARLQSVSGYFARSMELLDPFVRKALFSAERPIRTKDRTDASAYYGSEADVRNSFLADGCIIEGEVENSILFRGVHVAKGAKVSNCILMQSTSVREDADIQFTITDKNVKIHPGRILVGHETYPITIAKNDFV